MPNFLPEIYSQPLANGLNVVGVEYDRVPWVSLIFMAKRGSETDPPGKAGVADWAAEYLTLGTARRDQRQLAEDIESKGASLNARSGWDATYITIEGLAEDFADLLALMAEVVQTPGFPEAEFPLLRDRRKAELVHKLDEPRELANDEYTRLFFGGAPYGHAPGGDLKSAETMELDDLKGFIGREFTPAASSLVVVGMVEAQRVQSEAARGFGAWSGGGPASPAYTAAPDNLCAPGIYLLDRPDLTQSEIRIGHLGPPRANPDFFALKLVNYILGGGGFSSRLMARIRSDLGYTYGIRSAFHFRRAPGPFVISTFTPAQNTAAAVREIHAVFNQVQQQGVTARELDEAQSYYVGHFPLGLETAGGIARQVLGIELHNLGRDYLTRYCENIRRITLEAAFQAAQTHLRPSQLVTFVLGPAARCAEDLAALGPVKMLHKI
jgi:zinc protease